MFLALTSSVDLWHPREDLLFIAPWCTRHDRREDWSNRRYQVLPNPWDDLQRFRKAVAHCDEVYERLLESIGGHLNATLRVQHGKRYWRLLIGRWLSYHVQHMYDHHIRLQDALTAYPELTGFRLDPAGFRVPKNTSDAIRQALDDPYNLQIFSHFLTERGAAFPPRPSSTSKTQPIVLKAPNSRKAFFKRTLTRLLAGLVPPGFGSVMIADLNIPRAEQRRLFTGSRLKVLPYLAEIPASFDFTPRWDDARRALGTCAEGRDEFERVLIATLPHQFPTLYLEGYHAAREFSLSRIWRTPRVVFSAVGWYGNDAFKFAAAECAERGSALWGLQHGGVYGQWEHADGENFERAIVDRFFCWGWARDSGDAKLKDLPHPMLCRQDARPAEGKDGILLVPTVIHFHVVRLERGANTNEGEYIERQARFLRALPDRLKSKTAVRLFRLELGARHEDRLRELVPNLVVDDSSIPFPERLRTARVAVFDCPMTTFLEALAADVPSILTWDPEVWVMRAEARPYFDRLREAGILFDDPAAAARQAERVYNDPRTWWDSAEVREAREPFTARFALNRADWLQSWLEEAQSA